VARHRRRLHQLVRELRASARRDTERGRQLASVHLVVLGRKASVARSERVRAALAVPRLGASLARAGTAATDTRRRDLERLTVALAAHDPARTLERGYVLVDDPAGEPLGSARAAHDAENLTLRFHDGRLPARVTGEPS